jgi:hypothetical protein
VAARHQATTKRILLLLDDRTSGDDDDYFIPHGDLLLDNYDGDDAPATH